MKGTIQVLAANSLGVGHPLAILIYFYFVLAVLMALGLPSLRQKLVNMRQNAKTQARMLQTRLHSLQDRLHQANDQIRSFHSRLKGLPSFLYFTAIKLLRKQLITRAIPYFRTSKWLWHLVMHSLIDASFKQLNKLKKIRFSNNL